MLNLAQLNALDREEFIRVVAPVFEAAPWIAQRAWTSRPFADRHHLFQALSEAVRQSRHDEQLALIRGHPDLVGRACLSDESQSEQTAAGLADLSQDEIAQFQEYNAQYRGRFGFPFVICARENKKEAILTAFPERLQQDRETEIKTALGEVLKIAELRLADLIE